jgi:hypothetical protein
MFDSETCPFAKNSMISQDLINVTSIRKSQSGSERRKRKQRNRNKEEETEVFEKLCASIDIQQTIYRVLIICQLLISSNRRQAPIP